ncbi:MAG: 4-hydroxythreonine-4-phosphate dehydrogenase PdxA [Porphyromonadaceae bacterium]|nr:4-hydroxythreonine-4-phosphate dehydrogenase PdxA [Porphyromonadaceae bacterium]
MENKLRIGITHGDINGIGYEVILKTLSDPHIVEICTPIVYGSSKIAAYHRKALELPPVNFNIITSAAQCAAGKLNMINCFDDELKAELSRPTPQAGEAALLALDAATADWQAGLIDAIVTAPINKHTIQSDKFDFPGHTEYFEKKAGKGQKALMILLDDQIRVALVTTHLPIAKVPEMITRENILEKLTIFNRSLHEDFYIEKPRIAVLSLNPHAGEEGLLGDEEQKVIIPTLKEATDQGILCFGPYAADGFFGSRHFTRFDGVLAMYHDQGLAPFKTLDRMEEGVNFTAGLPLIRTSPAHGTAYDIAGQNKASETSFRHALYLAIDVANNRARHAADCANPLRKQYFDKSGDKEVLDLNASQDED